MRWLMDPLGSALTILVLGSFWVTYRLIHVLLFEPCEHLLGWIGLYFLKLCIFFTKSLFLLAGLTQLMAALLHPGPFPEGARKPCKPWTPNDPAPLPRPDTHSCDKDATRIRVVESPTGRYPECRVCRKWKPPRAHHCRKCGECVFRMDHHCPWINNCVGYRNQKIFILFLLYTGIVCAMSIFQLSLGMVITYIYMDYSLLGWICNYGLAGVAIIGGLFGLLGTKAFISEQLDGINSGTTLIELWQHKTPARPTNFGTVFLELFGEEWYIWTVPIPSHEPMDYNERVNVHVPKYACN